MMEQMDAARKLLSEVQTKVATLNQQLKESMAEKDELVSTAEELKLKLERAEMLVTSLAGEKGRWEESLANFDAREGDLVGDCFIAAAFMSYAGPFGSKYR